MKDAFGSQAVPGAEAIAALVNVAIGIIQDRFANGPKAAKQGVAQALASAYALLYVLPAYVLYARSEEAMMLEEFGEAYRQYGRTVPMFIPHLR